MPKIAIITRTKDRDIFLRRAFQSVAGQTCRDFIWVIVNDGGRSDKVEYVAKKARDLDINVLVIHRNTSTGMEAASNHGIRESESKYIVIHDDDDSWQPDFLKTTTEFLDHEIQYDGVITWNALVVETIHGQRIMRKKQKVQNRLITITIADMLSKNLFPPIAFLYRRSVIKKIGYYDERLPVCGDYDFNLRFIENSDIGVIPMILANHHFRPTVTDGNDPNGNSEIAQREHHIKHQALMRNRLFRRDLENNKIGIGVLLQINEMHIGAFRLSEKLYSFVKRFHSTKKI